MFYFITGFLFYLNSSIGRAIQLFSHRATLKRYNERLATPIDYKDEAYIFIYSVSGTEANSLVHIHSISILILALTVLRFVL